MKSQRHSSSGLSFLSSAKTLSPPLSSSKLSRWLSRMLPIWKVYVCRQLTWQALCKGCNCKRVSLITCSLRLWTRREVWPRPEWRFKIWSTSLPCLNRALTKSCWTRRHSWPWWSALTKLIDCLSSGVICLSRLYWASWRSLLPQRPPTMVIAVNRLSPLLVNVSSTSTGRNCLSWWRSHHHRSLTKIHCRASAQILPTTDHSSLLKTSKR